MRPAFDRAVARVGVERLNTIEYEGAGIAGSLVVPGQAYAPGEPWPQLGLKAYKRQVDYVREAQLEGVSFQRLIESERGGGLPPRGVLIEADVYSPGPPGAPVPAVPNHFTVNLADNVARLGLTVERILPMHGRVAGYAETLREIGRGP